MNALFVHKYSFGMIKVLLVLLLWLSFYARPLHAVSCTTSTAQYYSSIHKAYTACEADAKSSSCGSGACTYGGVVNGHYYWFNTYDPWGNPWYQRYYIKDCAEGEIVNESTGACLVSPQLNEEDKKKIGCNKNPCGPGISPAVGQ